MSVKVNLVTVMVRRDAFTTTPVSVAPYELTILRQMFGKENVHSQKDAGVSFTVDPATEGERLANKYGAAKVVKVYGDDGGERLRELVEREAEATARATPAKAEASTKAKASAKAKTDPDADAKTDAEAAQ